MFFTSFFYHVFEPVGAVGEEEGEDFEAVFVRVEEMANGVYDAPE